MGLAVLMVATALLGLFRPPAPSASTTFRRAAFFLLVAVVSVWILVSISHYLARPPTVRDFGEFGIYCLIPILLLLNKERGQLVTLVARLCVIMTLADLAYNLLAIAGVVTPPTNAGGLIVGGVRLQRYAGISGNVLAAGEVGLIGVIYSAWRMRCIPKRIPKVVWFLTCALCFLGLHLIIARRYEVAAIVGATIILIPWARWVPLPIYAVVQGASGLYFTFTSLDLEEVLRSRLISAAADDLSGVFWFGRGPYFAAPVAGTRFLEMWAGGITESGWLDIALAFGAPAAALFVVAVVVALLAKRASVTWMPVLVTVLAGTLPYNNPLGFLGSVVFFGGLLCVIMQEPASARISVQAPCPLSGVAMMHR
jgi:hypothetical protein